MQVMVAFSAFVTGKNLIGESSSLLYFSKAAFEGGCLWCFLFLDIDKVILFLYAT